MCFCIVYTERFKTLTPVSANYNGMKNSCLSNDCALTLGISKLTVDDFESDSCILRLFDSLFTLSNPIRYNLSLSLFN